MDVTVELGRKLSKLLNCVISGKYRVLKCFRAKIFIWHLLELKKVFLPHGIVLRNLKMKLFVYIFIRCLAQNNHTENVAYY